MEKKNELIKDVVWTIQSHPDESYIFQKIGKKKNYDVTEPVPDNILNIKLRTNNEIVLLYDGGEPILKTPFIGNTFGDWMMSLYNGLNKPIIVNDEFNYHDTEKIYKRIGGFFDKNDRLKYVKKFESNKLKPADLLGNHYFFEGNLKLEKKLWTYGLGS
jgi:hypothetical protein